MAMDFSILSDPPFIAGSRGRTHYIVMHVEEGLINVRNILADVGDVLITVGS